MKSSTRPSSIEIAVLVIAFVGASVLRAEAPCPERIYIAFDSRVTAQTAGRAAVGDDRITGFEIAAGVPFVTFEHRVVALKGRRAAGFPVIDRVLGANVDKSGEIRFDTQRGVLRRGDKKLVPDPALSAVTAGRLLNSGTDVFIEVMPEADSTIFAARRANGAVLPIARIKGVFRAASWNELGLAAIVGETLYEWSPGSKDLLVLSRDYGLRTAIDVCLIAGHRAIVGTAHATVLVTPATQLMLVGFPSRCRFSGGKLFLLDVRSGAVWSVDGLDPLGDPAKDRLHARTLIGRLRPNDSEGSPFFLEASRIVGCREARNLRQQLSEMP